MSRVLWYRMRYSQLCADIECIPRQPDNLLFLCSRIHGSSTTADSECNSELYNTAGAEDIAVIARSYCFHVYGVKTRRNTWYSGPSCVFVTFFVVVLRANQAATTIIYYRPVRVAISYSDGVFVNTWSLNEAQVAPDERSNRLGQIPCFPFSPNQ